LKKNATRPLLGLLLRIAAILAIALGILSLPWRADRPAATPSVAGARAGRGPLTAGAAVQVVDLGPAPTIGGFPRLRWAAEGVRDPITARALVLSEPGCSVAVVSAELLLVPEQLAAAVRTRVAGLGLDAVVVGATHTHAGPGGYWRSLAGVVGATGPYDAGTFERLVEALAGAIRLAHASRGPATVAVARGREAALVRNRTGGAEDGRLLAVRLARPDGAPLAELVTFAAHPTLLGSRNRRLSGDWTSSLLAEAPRGPRLFFQAAIGDQSTRLPPGTAAEADPVATYGAAVSRAVAALPSGPAAAEPTLAVASATVPLPPLTVMTLPAVLRPAARTVASGLLPAEATVTALRLDGALLVFTPAEPVELVGRAWRDAAGADAEVISLSDGYVGYVEDAVRVEAGQGEARRSYYGPALAERLEAAVAAAARAADGAVGARGGR